MPPLASEPRQILIILNLAKRKALYTLITEIIRWMRFQLELHDAGPNAGDGVVGGSSDGRPALASHRLTTPDQELISLRNAALAYFDTWKRDVLGRLK